jgi:hypothetical protein
MNAIVEGALIGAVTGGVSAGPLMLVAKLLRWGPKATTYSMYAAISVAIVASRLVPMMPWWASFRATLTG